MAERQFGPYRLVHQIATGGMAEVHLAKARGFGGFEKYIALKMIHPNFSSDEHFIEMLVDEAKITVQLQHVNIVQVYDLGRVGQTYYLTMEYVDGCDLYKILRRASEQDRLMPIDVAAYVTKEVCAGLDYAHRKCDDEGRPLSIVHRDISPQNVLISHASEVKIADFGIAKATMRAQQTAAGVIKGKYYYMSPEQAWGDRLDHRADIFSTGILLHEMLAGQMLYLEEDIERLLDMVRKADVVPPRTRRPDCPPALEAIVMKALARKPEDRWQSAHDFGMALERYLHAHAPDFTASKLATFVTSVLGEPAPPAPAPAPPPVPKAVARPEPEPARKGLAAGIGRVTRGMGRDAIMSRAEFTDENSVIFRMTDLAAAERDVGASAGDGGGTPRMADVATPMVPLRLGAEPASRRPGPIGRKAEPGEERTVISNPPGFGGDAHDVGPAADGGLLAPEPRALRDVTGEIFDPTSDATDSDALLDPTADGDEPSEDGAPSTIRRAATPTPGARHAPPPLPPGAARAAGSAQRGGHGAPPSLGDDEPTRMDLGRMLTPDQAEPNLGLVAKMHDGDAARRAPRDPSDRLIETPAALVASSQPPAVSALAEPRRSRRTPHLGVPFMPVDSAGPAGGVLGADAWANLGGPPLDAASRLRALASSDLPLSPPPMQAPASGSNSGTDLPLAPSPFDWAPGDDRQSGSPSVIEDPAIYRLTSGRSRRPLVAATSCIIAAVLLGGAGILVFGDDAPAPPASLEVISIPPGATVTIDGRTMGVTPMLLERTELGHSYLVHVDLAKHEPWEREETLSERGKRVKLIAALKPILGTLHVESVPSGAEVFLGNQSLGRTPLTRDNLDPFTDGTIELRLHGYRPERQALKWHGQREARLKLTLRDSP